MRILAAALLGSLMASPTLALTPALVDEGSGPAESAQTLPPEQAGSHIGQTAKVCGVVASAHYAARSGTTFLNLGRPYPNAPFTAVIFRDARGRFGTPERTLAGQRVCVTGAIKTYRGQVEIVLEDPGQLSR